LPEDEQTFKHGGGGRYNASLELEAQYKSSDEVNDSMKPKDETREDGKL
jgi:hypothetical protein